MKWLLINSRTIVLCPESADITKSLVHIYLTQEPRRVCDALRQVAVTNAPISNLSALEPRIRFEIQHCS